MAHVEPCDAKDDMREREEIQGLREQLADVTKECTSRGEILDELQEAMNAGSWLGCIDKFRAVHENADYHARQAAELRGQLAKVRDAVRVLNDVVEG